MSTPTSGTDPLTVRYPPTLTDVPPDRPSIWHTFGGFLIIVAGALAVIVIGIVIAIVVAAGLFIRHADSEVHKAGMHATDLFGAFTGQSPSSLRRGGIASEPRSHAFGPLLGQPTLRDETARAGAAFTTAGYTALTDAGSREPFCSLDQHPSGNRPPPEPFTVSVTCLWNGESLAGSSATIEIEVDVPLSAARTTLDGRQLLDANVDVVLDTPLRHGTIDVSADP